MASLLLTSCASMINGRNETIAVDSQPAGSDAAIACAGGVTAHGVTPAQLVIPRKADHCVLSISHDRMETRTVPLERGFSRHYWSNIILLTGLPTSAVVAFAVNDNGALFTALFTAGISGGAGLIYDRVTGAMYDHNPARVSVALKPVQ